MNVFNAGEILEFAVKIEENGEAYYRRFAQSLGDAKAKELFAFLADEEADHRKTFVQMLSKVQAYQPPESFPDEYFAYLRAYVDDVIFDRAALEKEVGEVRDVVSALNFGIRRETDSIFYYQEIRKFVPQDERGTVDRIIEEERMHFMKFHGLKMSFKQKR
jgi:rubrerythrin